MIYNAD